MTFASEAAAEAIEPADPDAGTQRAGARPRARITTPARATQATLGRLTKIRSGEVATARMPSLAEQHERHITAAQASRSPLVAWARYLWGVLHLLIKAALNGVEWATETPLRFVLTLVLLFVTWKWS